MSGAGERDKRERNRGSGLMPDKTKRPSVGPTRSAVGPPLNVGPPHGQALVPDGPTRHSRWARERHEFRRRRKGWLFG